jgi:hypothetical protein
MLVTIPQVKSTVGKKAALSEIFSTQNETDFTRLKKMS